MISKLALASAKMFSAFKMTPLENIFIIYQNMQKEFENLRDWSQFYGILKRKEDSGLSSYCIACLPYVTTTNFYDSLTILSNLWQKYCFLVSKDSLFIRKVLQPLRNEDPWVDFLLKIYQASAGRSKDELTYIRTDFFLDSRDGLPKLIEYNLTCVGMSYASKQLGLCQQICNPSQANTYFPNDNIDLLVEAVYELYQKRGFTGLFLFLIGSIETTFLEQKYVQSQLILKGIRCLRVQFSDLIQRGRVDSEGNYYLDNELVNFAYFRTGFNFRMYAGDVEGTRRCREQLAASNVISIPSISMELVNLKRIQTEMSKPQVIRQYLSEAETQQILSSLVPCWQFDTLSEEESEAIIDMYRRNPGGYVLKPNMEGGYNNYFGADGVEKLYELTPDERRHFILQEIIPPVYFENYIWEWGNKVVHKTCNYEIGRYGVVCGSNGELTRNDTRGYLLRTHTKGVNEESAGAGNASMVAWRHN